MSIIGETLPLLNYINNSILKFVSNIDRNLATNPDFV